MKTAEFLFPTDLEVTPTRIDRVLLIGSCLTALYHERFQRMFPDVGFDYLTFNYAGELPAEPPSEPGTYNFQYIQIPLRSVMTDRVIWANCLHDRAVVDDIVATGFSVIDAMLDSALIYRKAHGLLTFVANFIVPQMSVASSLDSQHAGSDLAEIVGQFNEYLARAIGRYTNVFIANVDGIASSIGKQYVLDDTIYFTSHNDVFVGEWVGWEYPAPPGTIPPMDDFYQSKAEEFLEAVYCQMRAMYRTCLQIDQVKAVVFDLDNTLWRGQVAEHYRPDQDIVPRPDGWPMGIWEAIHRLRARGVLVAVCSKNDREVVEAQWENVVQPAFLKLDDFVLTKIDWRPKSENLAALCRELNIKPKNVVFVDDNPVERAEVQMTMPEVRVIGANPYLTRRILLWAPETQLPYLTAESAGRERMMRSQIVREEHRAALSRDEFLNSLQCRVSFIEILSVDQPECLRTIELTNKTNQFNTTGRRWTSAELSRYLNGGGRIVAFRVIDRFVEYGIVGAFYIRADRIEQFVMSCRVMGMDVELFAIAEAVALVRELMPRSVLVALMRLTKDNSPCRDVFVRAGFVVCGGDGSRGSVGDELQFELSGERSPIVPGHIRGDTIRNPRHADSGHAADATLSDASEAVGMGMPSAQAAPLKFAWSGV